jgi:hypothetical protein
MASQHVLQKLFTLATDPLRPHASEPAPGHPLSLLSRERRKCDKKGREGGSGIVELCDLIYIARQFIAWTFGDFKNGFLS